MPYSLRTKISKLRYQGHLTRDEADRIRDALAKQIPKKVDDEITSDNEFIGYRCKCGFFLGIARNYCSNCGQKIDWSEEE